MERKHENNLNNGLAYLEFMACYTKDKKTGETLKSKNGNIMLNIQWSAVDQFGNVGRVYDYIVITDKAKFKVDNLENALGLTAANGLFDHDQERFNLPVLGSWTTCGAVIKNDEYGAKIVKYVPIAFYKAIEQSMEAKEGTPATGDSLSPVVATTKKDPLSTDIDFGDLPF